MRLFYLIKPLIPRPTQIRLRRWRAAYLRKRFECVWPIDARAANRRATSSVWPHGKRFALVLTHDVEDSGNDERCWAIISWEKARGLRSAFNLVPDQHKSSHAFRSAVAATGCEIGVHGLSHDGRLYESERHFRRCSLRINDYLREWEAVGFRSPAMQHNLQWLRELDIDYDSSTFDTDPFQPQSDGVGSILPFVIEPVPGRKGYVELPCTLPQDFTLFVELRETAIDIWKRKLDWIAETGGMALLNTHPDYMWFGEGKRKMEEYPARYYAELLDYVLFAYQGQFWNALPREVASYWVADRRAQQV